MIRVFELLAVFAFAFYLGVFQGDYIDDQVDRKEAQVVFDVIANEKGLSYEQQRQSISALVEDERYGRFAFAHYYLLSLTDLTRPELSQGTYEQALASLEGEEILSYVKMTYDRVMEIDRIEAFASNPQTDNSKFLSYWSKRAVFHLSAEHYKHLELCHKLTTTPESIFSWGWPDNSHLKGIFRKSCSKIQSV